MALIIENGSGVDDANSYATIQQAKDYAADRGITLGSDPIISSQLVLGTDYLESFNYIGLPVLDAQSLSWPRKQVEFGPDDPFPDDEIPVNLVKALCQLVIEQFNGVELQPSVNLSSDGGFVTEEKVDVLMTKYSEKVGTTSQPIMPKVSALLRGLIIATPALQTVRL